MKKSESFKTNTRIKLASLWTTLTLLYLYCDIFSFFRTGHLEEIITGKIGPFNITQGSLAVMGALMIPPALMVAISIFANSDLAKWINIIAGVLYTFVNIGNLVGETWIYYWIYGIIELSITIIIVIVAVKWPKQE